VPVSQNGNLLAGGRRRTFLGRSVIGRNQCLRLHLHLHTNTTMSVLFSIHDSGTGTTQTLAVAAMLAVILALCALVRNHLLLLSQQPEAEVRKLTGEKCSSSPPVRHLTPNLGVVVIGGGIAGMVAALELARRGVNSALVEAADKLGGNSARASSGIVATGTKAQRTAGVQDSTEMLFGDTMRGAGGANHPNVNPHLVKKLAIGSSWVLDYLRELSGGILPQFDTVVKCGGHRVARVHRPSVPGKNVGRIIVDALRATVEKEPKIRVITSATIMNVSRCSDGVMMSATLIHKNSKGRVTLGFQSVRFSCLVVTTGGFADDGNALRKWAPEVWHKVASPDGRTHATTCGGQTTIGTWTAGSRRLMDDLRASMRAKMVSLDQVQIHPTSLHLPGSAQRGGHRMLVPEAFRGCGGVLLSENGRRFVDELETRDVVTAAIRELPGKWAWLLVNEKQLRDKGLGDYIDFFAKLGGARIGTSPAALLGLEHLPPSTRGTLSARQKGIEKISWVAMQVEPAAHYTMGGFAIDEWARVKSEDGSAVWGLFAAGEATGGVHGRNRIAGNSLLECIVFGRAAAVSAAKRCPL
jgi:succinate dehydrogenase/fumarate reductase flavoprotein subunit